MAKQRNDTRRDEIKVLRDKGLSYYQIAVKLGISEKVVYYYATNRIDKRRKVSSI